MGEHGKEEEKPEEPTKLACNVQSILEELDETIRVTALEPEETDQFEQLKDPIDAAESRHTDHPRGFAARDHEIEWKDGDEVDREPTFDVVLGQ